MTLSYPPSPNGVIPMIRIAAKEGKVYAERVPGYWVVVTDSVENFKACNLETKVFLIQQAITTGIDVPLEVIEEDILG